MLEVLEFIFSSFWIWAGTLCMLAIITGGIGSTIAAMKPGCNCRTTPDKETP